MEKVYAAVLEEDREEHFFTTLEKAQEYVKNAARMRWNEQDEMWEIPNVGICYEIEVE